MKKNGLVFLLILALFLIAPIRSNADSTTLRITFASQEQVEKEGPVPEIKKKEKEDDLTFFVKNRKKRFPITGEEYTFVLSFLGWALAASSLFFFLIGKQRGRANYE